jgi:hypothetical protein
MVIGHPSQERMVSAAGHPFLGLDARTMWAGLEAREGRADAAVDPVSFERALVMMEEMERIVRDWRSDVILREPLEFVSAVAAMRLGIPDAQVATSLAEAIGERIEWKAPLLEAFRTGLIDELRGVPFLTCMPVSLDGASPFLSTWRYREPARGSGSALPPWWADSCAPLLYVTLGTVVGRPLSSAEIYRVMIDAVAGLDARVLVTVGRDFDISQLQGLPGNVHVEAWVDQADILAEARLVICHGGSGSVYGALAAGVPLVVIPMFADQFANATAVAAAGAGLPVLTSRATLPVSQRDGRWLESLPLVCRTVEAMLGRTVEAVLGDRSYRQAAQRQLPLRWPRHQRLVKCSTGYPGVGPDFGQEMDRAPGHVFN